MASDPVVKDRIFCAMEKLPTVSAACLSELRVKLGMSDVSNTKFGKALGSLHYHDRLISWRRFWPQETSQSKHHAITLLTKL